MKKRWASKAFKCKCGTKVEIGDKCYICECCINNVCEVCGDYFLKHNKQREVLSVYDIVDYIVHDIVCTTSGTPYCYHGCG